MGPSFVTSPLRVDQPAGLRINVDGPSAEAKLRVEPLDASERPLRGCFGDQTAVVAELALRPKVSWPRRNRISGLVAPFKTKIGFEGQDRRAIRFFALYVGE